jgi:hypothetical protein
MLNATEAVFLPFPDLEETCSCCPNLLELVKAIESSCIRCAEEACWNLLALSDQTGSKLVGCCLQQPGDSYHEGYRLAIDLKLELDVFRYSELSKLSKL